jgi:transcription initiation factor IIE alpha subunit
MANKLFDRKPRIKPGIRSGRSTVVYQAIEEHGEITKDQLSSKLGLPKRQLHDGLSWLLKNNYITSQPCWNDIRRSRYKVNGEK